MSKFGITPGLVRGRIEQFEQKIGKGTTNPAQPKQSPAARSPGAQLEGLSNFKAPDGAPLGAPRRSALPGQAKELGAQMASSAFHAASHFMPPGPLSTGMHALGDMAMPSSLGSGDPLTQMSAMNGDFLKQKTELTRMQNEFTMAAAVIDQSSKLTSALASSGNKGTDNITKAATGQ